MKTVYLMFQGSIIKVFQCRAADITGHSVFFYGVPKKNGTGTMTVKFFDDVTHDVDHLKREARVYCTNPEQEIFITW